MSWTWEPVQKPITPHPCAHCGEAMEKAWGFCPACCFVLGVSKFKEQRYLARIEPGVLQMQATMWLRELNPRVWRVWP